MYTKQIPFKDLKGNPRNMEVNFNLFETEVFKLFVEFQTVFKWIESMKDDEERTLEAEEVVTFYTAFEEIILSAYGEPEDDGLHFRKSGRRYDFEESALFNAAMMYFLKNPSEATKLVNELVPKDLEDVVKSADADLAETAKNSTDEELKAQIEKLRAQIASKNE